MFVVPNVWADNRHCSVDHQLVKMCRHVAWKGRSKVNVIKAGFFSYPRLPTMFSSNLEKLMFTTLYLVCLLSSQGELFSSGP